MFISSFLIIRFYIKICEPRYFSKTNHKHNRLDGKKFFRFVYFRCLKDLEIGDILIEKANILKNETKVKYWQRSKFSDND